MELLAQLKAFRQAAYKHLSRAHDVAFERTDAVLLTRNAYCLADFSLCPVFRLMDVTLFPALLLAQEYHSRWEAENTLDELKTHLNGRKTPIRSKNPREVVQEISGWLLAHYCVRCLMFQAASEVGISPICLGFTGTQASDSSSDSSVSISRSW